MQTATRSRSTAFSAQAMGVRVLLLSGIRGGGTACRLVRCGSHVDVAETLELAMDRLCSDRMGYDLFVMDCDGYGGIAGGERAVASLIAAEARMRVMLVSRDFDEPSLPFGRRTAVCLPAAIGEDDFRRGLDHALRDRLPVIVM